MTNTKTLLKFTKRQLALKQRVDSFKEYTYLAGQLTSINGMFGAQLHRTASEAQHFAGDYQKHLKKFQELPQLASDEVFTESAQALSHCFESCSAQLNELSTRAQAHRETANNAKQQREQEYAELLKQLLRALKIDPNKIGPEGNFDAPLAGYISRAVGSDLQRVGSSDGGTYVLIANRKLSKREIASLSEHAGISSDSLSALPTDGKEFKQFRLLKDGLINFRALTTLSCVNFIFTRFWSA